MVTTYGEMRLVPPYGVEQKGNPSQTLLSCNKGAPGGTMAEVMFSPADFPSPPTLGTSQQPLQPCTSLSWLQLSWVGPVCCPGSLGEAGDPGESRARSSYDSTAYWHRGPRGGAVTGVVAQWRADRLLEAASLLETLRLSPRPWLPGS